jgi:hypothetical protein
MQWSRDGHKEGPGLKGKADFRSLQINWKFGLKGNLLWGLKVGIFCCLGTGSHCVAQADLKLRIFLPQLQVLGLQATTTDLKWTFLLLRNHTNAKCVALGWASEYLEAWHWSPHHSSLASKGTAGRRWKGKGVRSRMPTACAGCANIFTPFSQGNRPIRSGRLLPVQKS